MKYSNSEEIVTFINKAQNKVAELSTLMVRRKNTAELDLAMQLLDLIEVIDNEWCPWTETEISQFIQYYNSVADLNNIPFLSIVGYQTIVNNGATSGGSNGSIYTHDIIDYTSTTKALITSTPHNKLKDIQGGSETERYHFTKVQYDKLLALITKAPTVSLSILSTIPAATNGVYEKGSSVTQVRMQGGVTLNDGGARTKDTYLVDGIIKKEYIGDLIGSVYEHNESIVVTTTLKFQSEFTQSTMKEAAAQIRFEAPYYSAIGKAGVTHDTLTKTKGLKSKGDTIVEFSLAAGNAMATNPDYPYVFFPSSWGAITSVAEASSTFEYVDSFKSRGQVSIALVDGALETYNMYEYVTATEGTMKFTFKF